MSSSNEAVQPSPLREEWRPNYAMSADSSDNAYASGEDDDDDDENATAIGVSTSTTASNRFVPRPNAFSHPPAAMRNQTSSLPPYGPPYRSSRPASSQRHSYPSQAQHSPYNVISPSHRVDHDAALRASLSTLLSCAAAARGLPKSDARVAQQQPVSNRVQPSTIGFVPESVLLGTSPETSPQRAPGDAANAAVERSSPDKGKRKAGPAAVAPRARSVSRDRRVSKKVRRSLPVTSMEEVSPTLLTWVVGAGVLVLVSAISFSAGYVSGREVGRAEASGLGEASAAVGSCGRDLASKGSGLGLRRWTGAAAGVSA